MQCCQLKEKKTQRNKTISVVVFQTPEGVKYEQPVQAEGAARGQSVSFSYSTPNGVELFRSSNKENVFLPRAALRLLGVTHI
ncbi:MAG: hypothetical protein LBL13_01375 [Bacteroidales bacterium]|nr:hypothetical protein [Bacteroidales bacterium]